jgi:hypothetical protein
MRSDWARVLTVLNYTGRRNNFEILRQYVESLSDENIIEPPPPIIESNEVDNYTEPIFPPISSSIPSFISPPIIERNPPVNQNFIPNENMMQQGGIYGLNTDPAKDAIIKLVSQQHKEINNNVKVIVIILPFFWCEISNLEFAIIFKFLNF